MLDTPLRIIKYRPVTYSLNDTHIQLTINSKIAILNGKQILLDEAPFIINDRTVVPVRFVSENLGCDLNYDE